MSFIDESTKTQTKTHNKHHEDSGWYYEMPSKQLSKTIPFKLDPAILAASSLTARGTNDHRIGLADEIMEATSNAVPATYNIMQQIVMKSTET